MPSKTSSRTNGTAPVAEVTIDTTRQVRLRNRDLIDFQRVTGKRFVSAVRELEARPDDPDWETLTAVLWLLGRRNNPEFTYEEALDADLDQESLMGLVSLIADPTVPAEAGTS